MSVVSPLMIAKCSLRLASKKATPSSIAPSFPPFLHPILLLFLCRLRLTWYTHTKSNHHVEQQQQLPSLLVVVQPSSLLLPVRRPAPRFLPVAHCRGHVALQRCLQAFVWLVRRAATAGAGAAAAAAAATPTPTTTAAAHQLTFAHAIQPQHGFARDHDQQLCIASLLKLVLVDDHAIGVAADPATNND